MANLCFIVGSPAEATMDVGIVSLLEERGHRVHCVTYQPAGRDVFLDTGRMVTYLSDHMRDEPLPFGEALEKLDKDYEEPGLRLLVNSDVLLRELDYEEGLRIIVNHIRWWERFFDEHAVDVVIMYVTAYRVGRTGYTVARKRKIRHLIIQTGVTHGQFSLCDKNEDWIWTELLDNVEKVESFQVTAEIRSEIHNIIEQVSEFKEYTRLPKPSWKGFLKAGIKGVSRRTQYIERNEWSKVYQQMLWWWYPQFRLTYDAVKDDAKYVFFPLHASWDAQILTRNPLHYNQLELVRQIGLSLPAGYYLYVKEHPYNIGGEARRKLQEIQSINNVRIIDPRVNSKLLIQGSHATFAINGTAGWEAFLFKKPVVVIGKPFYRYSTLVYGVSQTDELPSILRVALTEGALRYEAELNKWFGFIYHAANTCYPGNPWGYKSFWGGSVPTDLTKKNIEQVTEGIHRKVERVCREGNEQVDSDKY